MAKQTKPSASAAYKTYKNINLALGDSYISFPANLITAAREEGSGLRLAVVKDGKASPVSQFYTADSKEYFPIGQLDRAIEFGEKLIPVSAEERAALKVTTEFDKCVKINKFVPLPEIDPVFFDNSYVIVPDTRPKTGDAQAVTKFSLLLDILVRKNRVGMATMCDRGKEYPIIVRPSFDGQKLMLHTLFTSAEVRNIDVPKLDAINPAYLETFGELVDAISDDHFDPSSITTKSDDLMAALIARKIAQAEGIEPETPAPTPTPTPKVDNLMAALQASLNKVNAVGKPQLVKAEAAQAAA